MSTSSTSGEPLHASSGERPGKPFASWWARDIVTAKSCTLSGTARALLMLLASFTNAAYYCEPSVETLARGIAVSHRSVQRARRQLVAAGLVRVFAGTGRGHTNGYWLPVSGIAPKGDSTARKGDTDVTLSISTRVTPMTPFPTPPHPEVIHKGDTGDAERVTPVSPEVDIEVSRERARVFSPAQPQQFSRIPSELADRVSSRAAFVEARRRALAARRKGDSDGRQ